MINWGRRRSELKDVVGFKCSDERPCAFACGQGQKNLLHKVIRLLISAPIRHHTYYIHSYYAKWSTIQCKFSHHFFLQRVHIIIRVQFIMIKVTFNGFICIYLLAVPYCWLCQRLYLEFTVSDRCLAQNTILDRLSQTYISLSPNPLSFTPPH